MLWLAGFIVLISKSHVVVGRIYCSDIKVTYCGWQDLLFSYQSHMLWLAGFIVLISKSHVVVGRIYCSDIKVTYCGWQDLLF